MLNFSTTRQHRHDRHDDWAKNVEFVLTRTQYENKCKNDIRYNKQYNEVDFRYAEGEVRKWKQVYKDLIRKEAMAFAGQAQKRYTLEELQHELESEVDEEEQHEFEEEVVEEEEELEEEQVVV